MPSTASSRLLHKRLSHDEVRQRVIRLPPRASFFPEAGQLFDVWYCDQAWAAKIRKESCTCSRPGGAHVHRYIECAELHAGLFWSFGAELRFAIDEQGRIKVSGDLEP